MKTLTVCAAFDGIMKAYKRRKKMHMTLRLTSREQEALLAVARGRSVSAALEEIVAQYVLDLNRADPQEKTVKKSSFAISEGLALQLNELAAEAGTTKSAIVHSALKVVTANIPYG